MVRKILELFGKEYRSVEYAALLLTLGTFASQLLGLVRDRLLAHNLGPSFTLDLYYASFRIPDILFALGASLVSVTILIPFFIEYRERDTREGTQHAKKFLDSIFTSFSIFMVILVGVTYAIMPLITPLIAPGFSTSERELLTTTSRIMLLSPLILGISNFLGSLTQTYRKFFISALTPVVYNLGIIFGIIALYPTWGVQGLVWGVVMGSLFHMGIQIPFLLKEKQLPSFSLKIIWQDVRRVIFISLPRTLTLSVSKLVFLVLSSVATLLSVGSVSILNFAYNLQSVPLALIGMSFSVAAFPVLVEAYTRESREEFILHIVRPLKQIFFWSLPVLVAFIVLRAHIVRLVLGTGSFSWDDTRLTASSLALFVFSVVAQSVTLLLVRGYYAAGKTYRPLALSLLGGGITIIVAYFGVGWFQNFSWFQNGLEITLRVVDVPGTEMLILPLAFTLGSLANSFGLWICFVIDFQTAKFLGVGKLVFQVCVASLVFGFGMYGILQFMAPILETNTFWGLLMQAVGAVFVGLLGWFITLKLFKNQEFENLLRGVVQKIPYLKDVGIISSVQEEL